MALVLFLDVSVVPSAFKDQMKSHGSSVENQGKWFLRDLRSERDKLNPKVGDCVCICSPVFCKFTVT